MKLSLVVTQGKPEGAEIPIRLSQFLIGRDPECHLRPSSPLVSKRHCAFIVRDGKVFLRDFDSTNGTSVNNKALKGEIELKDGDEVKIGPLGFRVKLNVTAQDTPTPPPAETAVHGKTAPAPKPAAKKPATPKPGSQGLDEDSVMEMLLNLEGEAGVATANDPIPPGSTIMQIVAPEGGEAQPVEEPPNQSPTAKKGKEKPKPPVDPQTAAKAILDKYMRRPRT